MDNKMLKNKKKGFTLVEILAAVLMAAVAAAIGILMVPQLLEKSRENTDINNMQEAKTLMETYIVNGGDEDTLFYDATAGSLKTADTGIVGYGKGTSRDGGTSFAEYDTEDDYKGKIIRVDYDEADDPSVEGTLDFGAITVTWVDVGGGSSEPSNP